MWTSVLGGHFIPLTWMTLGADYVVWGMNAQGYHLTSVLLHAANAGLVFLLGVRLLRAAGAEESEVGAAALIGALVFAVHPLRVESVAWITERRDLLSLFFLLLATLAYSRPDGPRHGRTLLFFALSLLSKASGMTFPVVLSVLDVCPLGRRRAPGIWREKIPYWLLAAAGAGAAAWAMARGGTMLTSERYGLSARAAQALYGLGFYVRKTVWPSGLSPIYEVPAGGLPWGTALAGGAAAVAITLLVLSLRRRWPAAAAAWFSHVALLLPTLGLFQSGPQLVADRYSYMAGVPLAVLAAAAAGLWRRTRPAFAVVILVFAGLTWRGAGVWRSPETLWTRAVAVSPESPMAQNNLGLVLKESGRIDEALARLEEAVRLKPDFAFARSNLGAALAAAGRPDAAFRECREAVRLAPGFARGHYNFACALAEAGRDAEAAAEFEATLKLDPALVEAANNLGNLYIKHGRWEDAAASFTAALAVRPGFAEAECNLGIALSNLGRKEEAVVHYRRAVAAAPELWAAYYNLGLDLEALGRREESRDAYHRAWETTPPGAAVRRKLEEKFMGPGIRHP